MEQEFKKQLNLSINGHLVNLRDEEITPDNIHYMVQMIQEAQKTMGVANVGEAESTQVSPTPTCPDHKKPMRAGHRGGYFCATKLEDGTWCQRKA